MHSYVSMCLYVKYVLFYILCILYVYKIYIYMCIKYTYTLESDSEVAQSCPTLCDPMDSSLPGSIVHGIFQARYWSGMPFPSPGDLPDPGIEPGSPAL